MRTQLLFLTLLAVGGSAGGGWVVNEKVMTFADVKRCEGKHCAHSQEWREKFSPRVTVTVRFPTDGAVMAAGKFPLVVFGHGDHMSFLQLQEALVLDGAVCAELRMRVPARELDLAKDFYVVAHNLMVESLSASSALHGSLDGNVTFVGHREMATHALMMGVAEELFPSYKHDYGVEYEGEPARLAYRGVVAISPIAGGFGLQKALGPHRKNIELDAPIDSDVAPALVLAGQEDCLHAAASNAKPIYGRIQGCKTYVELLGAVHCNFPSPSDIFSVTDRSSLLPLSLLPHNHFFFFLSSFLFLLMLSCEGSFMQPSSFVSATPMKPISYD